MERVVPSGHGRCRAASSSSDDPNEDTTLPGHRANRRIPAIVPALIAAACLLFVAGPAAAEDRPPPRVSGTPLDVTFYGRGWGHGVGMSQYGARGRALAGQTTAQILAHYYAGTTLGTKDPATKVRVLVLTGFPATSTKPAVVYGRGGSWTIAGIATVFPKDAKLTLTPTSAGAATYTLTVTSAGGARLHSSKVSGSFAIRAGSGTVLQLDSKPSSFDPAEMPSGWPSEALKAQAIAARSYAVVHLHPTTGTYDVYDDTRSQVYHGVNGEVAATNSAIKATSGIVLKSGSAVANAMFHSTGGGATENNEYAFVSATGGIIAGPVSYLRGSSDRTPSGASYDAAAPLATWKTGTYTWSQLSTILGSDSRTNVGSLSRLDLSRRGVSGRLISVTVIGTTGSKRVSGDVFRSVFNANNPAGAADLRSNLFDTKPIP
jgi:stage II sporulation protein D